MPQSPVTRLAKAIKLPRRKLRYRPRPLHLPLLSRVVARAIICEEHMQQTALGMPPRVPSPRVPGWKPGFPDFAKGLDQVIEAWHGERDARME